MAAVQTLFECPIVRLTFASTVQEPFLKMQANGRQYWPLLGALIQVYTTVEASLEPASPVQQIDCQELEVELFKAGYIEGSFGLNEPHSDAAQILGFLLSEICRWTGHQHGQSCTRTATSSGCFSCTMFGVKKVVAGEIDGRDGGEAPVFCENIQTA